MVLGVAGFTLALGLAIAFPPAGVPALAATVAALVIQSSTAAVGIPSLMKIFKSGKKLDQAIEGAERKETQLNIMQTQCCNKTKLLDEVEEPSDVSLKHKENTGPKVSGAERKSTSKSDRPS